MELKVLRDSKAEPLKPLRSAQPPEDDQLPFQPASSPETEDHDSPLEDTPPAEPMAHPFAEDDGYGSVEDREY
jgi:hypothetical protein